MAILRISLEFHSFWHAGTGRGDGADVDARSNTSVGGLPLFPGKTLKGILREAVELLRHAGVTLQNQPLTSADIISWFGTPLSESNRFITEPGQLRFTSAVLGANQTEASQWENWAVRKPQEQLLLFRRFSSTQIDQEGCAKDASLRSIQVAVPMTLFAHIEGPDTSIRWKDALTQAFPLVRTIGAHRSRGLGRVTLRSL